MQQNAKPSPFSPKKIRSNDNTGSKAGKTKHNGRDGTSSSSSTVPPIASRTVTKSNPKKFQKVPYLDSEHLRFNELREECLCVTENGVPPIKLPSCGACAAQTVAMGPYQRVGVVVDFGSGFGTRFSPWLKYSFLNIFLKK